MKSKDGLYIYFYNSGELGRSTPIELKSLEDIDYLINEHKGYHTHYMVIEKNKEKGDNCITSGEIEASYSRRRKK